MSKKKKEELQVNMAKEDIETSDFESELEKTDNQDEPDADGSPNGETNGASSPKYEFPKNNKENANEYDLIRFYLHEIADHSLLSREEEIRIAKKIEVGKRIIAKTILSSSLMLNEVCGIGEELQKGDLDIRDVTNSLDDVDGLGEETQIGIGKLINEITRLYRDNEQFSEEINLATQRNKNTLLETVKKNSNKMVLCLEEINLSGIQVERILSVARDYIKRLDKIKNELVGSQKKAF